MPPQLKVHVKSRIAKKDRTNKYSNRYSKGSHGGLIEFQGDKED